MHLILIYLLPSNPIGKSPMNSTGGKQKRKRKAQILGGAIQVSPSTVSVPAKQTESSKVSKGRMSSRDVKELKPTKEVKKNRSPLFLPSYIDIEPTEASLDPCDISTDDLLQEIYNQEEEKDEEQQEKAEHLPQQKEAPDTSVLDELFSPSLMERIKRKPAPRKGGQKKTGSDDLFSDSSSAKEDMEEIVRPDNTLKDDDIDCFVDPSHKKRNISKAQAIVSRLKKESEAAYRQLPVVPIGSDLEEVDSCDRTPSLF